jgi:hypothetical protein
VIVDIMEVRPGVYFCAYWCEDGRTSIRGNFCPKCAWDEAFYMLSMDIMPNHGWEPYLDLFNREVFDRVGLRLL